MHKHCIITDKNTNLPINGATIVLIETNQNTNTNAAGEFSIPVNTNTARTLQINKEAYMFEDLRNLTASSNLAIELRPKVKSAATLR